MRCYHVLIHGLFDYHVQPAPTGFDLKGFYAGRSVLARDEREAVRRAFALVRKGLADWNADLRDGLISSRLEAEEISRVPFWYVLRRSNRGLTLYADD